MRPETEMLYTTTTTPQDWTLGPPVNLACSNCGTRPAVLWWSEGPVAAVHGCVAPWCDRCSTEAQLKFARERAADIPRLEQRLAELP